MMQLEAQSSQRKVVCAMECDWFSEHIDNKIVHSDAIANISGSCSPLGGSAQAVTRHGQAVQTAGGTQTSPGGGGLQNNFWEN